jgi:hypothetical protein
VSHKLAKALAVTAAAAATAGLAVTPAEAATQTLVYDQQYGVCESATTDLPVDFNIHPRDTVWISAGSDIWSGVWFQSRTGPAGRVNEYGDNAKYPLPGERKFALLVKMDGGYRYAGSSFTRSATYLYDQAIKLRINDDVPNNGNGCFSARVRVYR